MEGGCFLDDLSIFGKNKWGTNVGAEVIDNNLAFFDASFKIFDVLICKPFVDKSYKCVDAT
ncbi:hypothetical protein HMPREF2874_02445 [Rothia sp. HMSC068F09]|nr:hypothetical protein HMPREF2874_02445 [Rothia sp. HMSC068F09]